MISRRRLLGAAAGAIPAAGAGSAIGMLLPRVTARAQPAAITTAELVRRVFLLRGAGCNVIAMPGADGALMIDGGLADHAEALLAAVFDATGTSRVHMLVNTHWHPEATGANIAVGEAGGRIFAHEKTRMYLANSVYSATFEGRRAPLPEAGLPTEVTRGDGSLEFEGMQIDYGYLPAAHTDGDLYLHLPELNLLICGGVVSGENWPLLDYRNGAWFGARVRALQWLAELVEPDTRVVPAHGKLITGREIVRQRDIYDSLFETMIGYMNMGFGPEDAVEHNPLAEYESEFGDPSEFLDGAYRSMLIAYVPD